jgi:hypothetical protein
VPTALQSPITIANGPKLPLIGGGEMQCSLPKLAVRCS